MYHIKNDKRSKRSAELIYSGLCQCLTNKPFDQITISDIQLASSVSRSTFYRHFDNLSDVLYWRCDQCFIEVWKNYVPQTTTIEEDYYHFVKYFLNYWLVNSDILELLLSIHRIDIIYDCHINNLEVFLDKYSSIIFPPSEYYDYFMGIRSGFMIGVLIPWVKNNKKQSVEELLEILNKQLDFIRKSNLLL